MMKLRLAPLALASVCGLTGCGSGGDDGDGNGNSGGDSNGLPIPIPDDFDVYFVAGSVCMPTNIATSDTLGSAPGFPIRFDICRHRCIGIDPGTTYLQTSFQCGAGLCNMVMLARAHAYRVQSEMNCDGRELPSPPAGSCTPESYTFANIDPPVLNGAYVSGNMQVSVPFMDLEQAAEVETRVQNGENAQTVLLQVVGPPPATRQWAVNLSPSHPAVTDGATLAGADCHTIPAP